MLGRRSTTARFGRSELFPKFFGRDRALARAISASGCLWRLDLLGRRATPPSST